MTDANEIYRLISKLNFWITAEKVCDFLATLVGIIGSSLIACSIIWYAIKIGVALFG